MEVSFPRATWRLILSPPASGAWNMAVDEALLEAAARCESRPVLRLYAWEPPCLSLGYTQPYADADLARLAERGWDLVRRPTGGRAILHTDELTYAVIGPETEPRLAGSVLESYKRLAAALLAALRLLGIPAEAKPDPLSIPTNLPAAERLKQEGPVCFEVPSQYEITAGEKKLVGSAQARRREGVLQHGSLPLSGDLGRITQALVYPDEAARSAAAARLLERAATAQDLLGEVPSWKTAAGAFVSAFSQTLNLDFVEEPLTKAEEQRAHALVAEKYAHREWTARL